ncbi:MAG: isoquinoline 1-oxidoreductase [Opitutia bacterium Tous-C4FEB]|nr:MAG: isoquinoline 1-oxidoreductase [Opitutae bacterium Tous-C5TDCM]PAW90500.1 MAG: isoquinoline 1-oxidoreductase [Opitutae bacterium Tous-C4FEB]
MNTPLLSRPVGRRDFLKFTGLAGGGFALAFYIRSGNDAVAASSAASATTDFAPNAFVRITTAGKVTIVSKQPEMGQGVKTSLPMIIAEQLEVPWKEISIEQGDFDEKKFGNQSAGGSNSTPNNYDNFHLVGATVRTMLVEAAAQTWGVPAAECRAEKAAVIHTSGKSLTYGQLAAKASTLPVPAKSAVTLKQPKDFKLLGTRVAQIDTPAIVTGKPLFGIDMKLPGMLYAVYEKCPAFGGKVVSANLDQIKTLPGVKDAFILGGNGKVKELVPGVAIIADSTWAAMTARKQLKIVWDEGKVATESWDGFVAQAKEKAAQPGARVLRKDGDPDAALAGAAKVVEANYVYPFISHANLEPQNTTAHWKDGVMEIWSPTQIPTIGSGMVNRVLGIPPDKIILHITRAGGGFGRRIGADYLIEAAAIAQKVNAPVKLTWSREDDLQHDQYRPGGLHFLKGGVDAKGKVVAWKNHFFTFGEGGNPGSGGNLSADEFPGRWIANYQAEQTMFDTGWPMGPWRAPGGCVFAWVFHSFIDELAHAGGRDPLELRLEILGDKDEMPAGTPPGGAKGKQNAAPYNVARMRNVLKFAAEKAGWGKKKFAKGSGAGLAFHFSHRGYFAQVAEVTVTKDGELKVDRFVTGADIGAQVVNLSGAENQVEGSVLDGLCVLKSQEINIERGRVVQGNFNDYPLMRITEAPAKVETYFLSTNYPTTGLGEPALPPVAPAICNAIFAATGKRIRQMPLSRVDLRWS